MKVLILFFLMANAATIYSQRRDVKLTDISSPNPNVQVISAEQYARLATQEEAMRDIKERLGGIDNSIKDMKTDLKALTDTNVIIRFLTTSFSILFPGLIIAYFSVQWSKQPKKRTPTRGSSA